MKATLTTDLVSKMTLDKAYQPGVPYAAWQACSEPNYLVYDQHRTAPPGFALRVGKNASVFLVEKYVAKKKLKIHVGLARGRKGGEELMELDAARLKAFKLIESAKLHGANPKDIEEQLELSELTLKQIWDSYLHDLMTREEPIKPNSVLSIKKGRDKFADWEDRKVKHISADEILKRFDLIVGPEEYKTAAEAACRWATAAINHAISKEVHNANAQKRVPSLTYNPFTILETNKKYRSKKMLERSYAKKGIRNPLTFSETIGPFVQAAYEYRKLNPLASDYLLLDLLWGLRGDECRTLKWKDRLSKVEAHSERWVDMKNRVVQIYDAKNRDDHVFPIGPFAYEILKLRRLEQTDGTLWVFPARSSRSQSGHYADPSRALDTVRQNAGIEVIRGHDLRRTFGGALEALNFTDRQTKRMLGHGAASGETSNRYTTPEWIDVAERMRKVEEIIISTAPEVYNALRPAGVKRINVPLTKDVKITPGHKRKSRRKLE